MTASQTVAGSFIIEDPDRDLLGAAAWARSTRHRRADRRDGRVKALNPDVLARDPGLLERFLREGEALRRLNHPNIVRMVAACEQDGRHYLVMEYVGGGSLEGCWRSKTGFVPNRWYG